jgi:Arc/MetJ family transcription regulator
MARMHKTTIEVDLDALGEAERNLGTKGFKETVNGALADVNRRAALRRAAERVRAGDYHVPDEKTWAAWRAPRV